MRIERQKFKQLTTNRPYTIEYEAPPIGQGAQGKVYKIQRVNGTLSATWAIKLLNDSSPELIRRLYAFVNFVNKERLNTDSLSCIPTTILQAGSGQIGICMRYAEAADLDNNGGLPRDGTLAKRLAIAHALASSVRRLHTKGMIIGDLAHDNLIVVPQNWALYLIDLDGAGFSWNNQNYPVVANNSAKGPVVAPEHTNNKKYTLEMDFWSLAALLHKLLTDRDPIDFFGLTRKYASLNDKFTWPPTNHAQSRSHVETLRLFGEPLKNAFIKTFNEGRVKPSARLTALHWEILLDGAQKYMYRCNSAPNKPYVALNGAGQMLTECRDFCSNCPTPIMAPSR